MSANVNVLLAFFIAVFFTDSATGLNQAHVHAGIWQHGWQNHWDGYLKTGCHDSALTGMQSVHSNHHEDRLFKFACSSIYYHGHKHITGCYWGSWSWWDHPFQYTCPPNYFISGWQSHHNNHREDRQMRYMCCTIPRLNLRDCRSTGWLNWFDQPINYLAPTNNVIVSVDSYHSNHHEDRRFAFRICKAFFY